MKKILFLIVLTAITGYSYAQVKGTMVPDYDKIEKNIKDENSPFFYPRLLERAEAWDTTLTGDDYHHLYYGHVFSDNYHPYGSSSDDVLQSFYQSADLSATQMDAFIKQADSLLKENPVDLRLLNALSYVYHLKGNEDMAVKVSIRFGGTFNAILSTGDGETCETAFHVLYIAHEYVFLNVFEFQMKSQSLINEKKHSCDYLHLVKDNRGIEGIYFNIDKPFGTLMKF